MKFKFLSHTADVKFIASGDSLRKMFINSAYALKEIITDDKITIKKKNRINVKGNDYENLLYNFLEEFLFLFETKGFLLRRVESLEIIKSKKGHYKLSAEVSGDDKEHEIKNHVKAITYNDMFVKKEKYNWDCQVVLDV